MHTPAPVEIIEGIVWADSLSLIASESGASKTFVALSAAAAVTDGLSWHGRATRHGSVVYISFEGDALGVRLRALHDVCKHRLNNLHIVRGSYPLSPRVTREGEERSLGEAIIAAELEALQHDITVAGEPRIVWGIIDTVRASMTGPEDNSEHVSAYLRAMRRLMARVPGAGWTLVHHAGWQDSDAARKRERGSSAWRGNCDATL